MKAKGAGAMASMVECMPDKGEAEFKAQYYQKTKQKIT
jgi:hypothetical protein